MGKIRASQTRHSSIICCCHVGHCLVSLQHGLLRIINVENLSFQGSSSGPCKHAPYPEGQSKRAPLRCVGVLNASSYS